MGSTREKLICHPDDRPQAVRSIWLDLEYFIEDRQTIHFNIAYEVICDPARIVVPTADGQKHIPDTPSDGLWQSTCFEMFTCSPTRSEYFEYNFAPDGRWAAYRFQDYRADMTTAKMAPCRMDLSRSTHGIALAVAAPFLPIAGPDTLYGFSAVIEEVGGTKSHWALRHPRGRADFHHPTCFALRLGAPDGL